MNLELFKETYIQTMMEMVRVLYRREQAELSRIIVNGNHYEILEGKQNLENLATTKMLLDTYPACDICLDPKCEGDHK